MKHLLLVVVGLLLTVTPFHAQEPALEPLQVDGVFYEIFVRSFYDSDGDGIGDFNGMIEKLDYLNDGDPNTTSDLGITGIWLMPITESVKYHGYDTINYYNVEPDYGTNEDFKRFIEEAHKRGIKVIIDLKLNHTSREHPWFIESQDPNSDKADWYVWSDEDPGYRGPENQQVWHRFEDRFYYGLFESGMPDLNLMNPEVEAELHNITRFWLEEMGVDGFRLDAIKYLVEEGRGQEHTSSTFDWLTRYQEFVRSVKPDAMLVGEVWSSTQLIVPYLGNGVDYAFEFDTAEALSRAGSFGLGNVIARQIDVLLASYPPGQYATFLANHDQNRIMTRLRGNIGGARNAASLLLTLPGLPFVYYGEEIGMTGQKPDEEIRTPMQWSDASGAGFTTASEAWNDPQEDYVRGVNVAAQDADPQSLLNHYRGLINARVRTPALMSGDYRQVEASHNKVFAFTRSTEDQTVLVVMNLDDRAISDYTLSLAAGSAGANAALIYGEGELSAPVINDAGGFADYTPIPELAPFSVAIIELSK